nr:uncharacterized mitochondrial protein AtMg00810-like [Tanacetum cinerariifolium]
MDSEKYLEGQSMQRPPLFESDSFIYWRNRFETYVKSKDLDLWQVITNGDFQPIEQNPETKLDEVIPFKKQMMILKRNLRKITKLKWLFIMRCRKEYERIFMCNTAKEIWKTLLITHQGNSQVKDNKINLLVQQYELFVIFEDESIDNAFARFNTIITSLKALNEGYSSRNYVRKFFRALHHKWRAKVTAIEESKDLTSLSLDELIGNIKVYKMIIKEDSKIVKVKVERKSLALKAKKESSDEECLTSKSEDEEYAMAERDFKKFFKRRDCPKPPKDKNQRAFVRGSWSNSGEEDDEKVKNETCLVAQASSKICLGVDLEPDKWIKDSGCSKHMTGNRKLFATYKAYNGGNIIFGSNLCGNIIGKGHICDNKCRVTFFEHDSEITKDGKVIVNADCDQLVLLVYKVTTVFNKVNAVKINGNSVIAVASASAEGPIPSKTTKQKLARKNELKAKSSLMLAIPDEYLLKFMPARMQVSKLISQLEIHGEVISQEDANLKLLRSLTSAWNNVALIMRNKSDLDTLTFVSSDNTSSTNEIVNTAHGVSAASSKDQTSTASYVDDVMFSFFSNQSNAPQRGHFAKEFRVPKNQGNRNIDAPTRNAPVDTSTTNALVVQNGIGGDNWSFQAEEELTNFALMAHTLGYQRGLESLEARIVIHKKNEAVYEEDIAFLKYDVQVKDISIKDLKNQLENDLKEKYDLKLKLEKFEMYSKNLTKLIDSQISATDKTGLGYDGHVNEIPPPYVRNYMHPRADLSFAGLDDSVLSLNRCSRHMTGNKSYLTDYQEIDGGFVAFGGNAKGGKITRKGKIRTGKLDFEDVVLFTDTECVVLSPDFKFLDESQVFLKATLGESNLCDGRLGHINIKTMNTLVRGNLARGYFINSKAFRVFNTRTKIVKENLHITFLENKPNVVGIGPNWMFDIDTLTMSMNYQPVFAGNQTNGNECTKSHIDTGLTGKKTVSGLQYVLLPSLTTDSLGSKSSEDEVADDARKKNEFESMFGQDKDVNDNRMFTNISAAGSIFVYLGGLIPVNTATLPNVDLPIDPLMHDLEDTTDTRIFSGAYDDEVEGAKADFNNLELTTVMDVKSAFLYGTIEKEVYVCQPHGFEDLHFPKKVYKVEKALYGLHQAPRDWYETLSTYLLENRFRRGIIDKTLFIKKDKNDILLVRVYVDDIIFGFTKKSLWLQVMQKDDGIFISQDKYVADILKRFDFSSVKTTSTPIETNKALLKDEEAKDADVHLYRSMIGSLMYLTASRPDIMFAVCACARFQVTPKISHLHVVKRIFRYMKGQPKLGLWYPRDSPFDLEDFSDSDVGASLDKKSTTRGCQFHGKRLISWKCKKQTVVANSSTKAE